MLAILTTHPIQYQVPLWQALARDGRVPFEVWYLTRHGVERSHDVEFGKEFTWDIDTLSGYPHRFLETAPGATPTTFWQCRLRERLRDRLRTSGARALWVQGWQVSAYWQAVWEARRAGVPVWLRGESNDLAPVPPWKRAVKRLLLGQFFRRVDRFLCIGTANRRLYQKFGVPEARLHSAPYAVDNERFKRQKAEMLKNGKAEIKKQWKIPEDAFCVLFCGKFIPKKRPLDLVAAARRLLEDGRWKMEGGGQEIGDGRSKMEGGNAAQTPNSELLSPNSSPSLHLLFVGSGELGGPLRDACHVVFDGEPEKLKSETLKAEIKDSLLPAPGSPLPAPPASFAGFLNQTEISRAYVAADCLVLPSDYGETWGLVVNEAMAGGLPCVISDRCGCAEDLGRIPPNEVFPCGDVRALAEQLMRMPDRAKRGPSPVAGIGAFSFDRTVSTVCALYGNP